MSFTTLARRTASIAFAIALSGTALAARPAAAQTQQAKAAPLDDPTIVAIFDAANTWDIQTGDLAAKKGSTKEIRDFGKMLSHDHTQVRKQGRALAAKADIEPTPPENFAMKKDHDAALKKLKSLKGTAFDKAFLEHEVAYHKAVIDAVTTTLLPAIQNQQLKAFVTQVAPAFQAHEAAAEALLKKQ